MFKKIAILAILATILIFGNLFAQSIDVVVHNVLKGGDVVELWRSYIPNQQLYLYATKPAPVGTGWTTVTFENVPCTQASPIYALKAEQGPRSDSEGGGISPFTTVHLYLPKDGVSPEPEDNIPHQY